ncbi:hypothetical protein IFM61392_09791 [Aspergillus lentulus]|nr:hypothetical protein IFM61392_09791 [Aspergillus lentulus]
MSQLTENPSPGHLQPGAGRTIGFDLQPLPGGLEPPTSIEPDVTRIRDYSEKYLWVLNNNGSISFNRGESPISTQLCERLSRLFTIPRPHVLEGPSISWVQVVRFAGDSPEHLDQSMPLRVGDSTIQLSEEDHESLLSGRPWRYLDPWPVDGDYERELALVNEDLDVFRRVKDMLSKVVESLDDLDRQLSLRGDLLSQALNGQPHPSAFESRTSPGICTIEHVAPRTAEISLSKDASGEESLGQECKVEPAPGFPHSQPHASRDSSLASESGHSTSTVEENYGDVSVTQLSTPEVSSSKGETFIPQAAEDLVQHASQGNWISTPTPIRPFIRKLFE